MPKEFCFRFVDSHKEATSYQGPSFSDTLPPISSSIDRKVLGDDVPSNWPELVDVIEDLLMDGKTEEGVRSIWFYTRIAHEWMKLNAKWKESDKLAFDEYERTSTTIITPITSKEEKKGKSEVVQKKESGIVFHLNSDSQSWSSLPRLGPSDTCNGLDPWTLGLMSPHYVSERVVSRTELHDLIISGCGRLQDASITDLKTILLSLHVLAHLYLAFPKLPESAVVVLYYG